MRSRNTNNRGATFSETTVQAVWNKGKPINGRDSANYRLDACNAVMSRTEYGNTKSSVGWEIDHIKPVSKGGSDDLSNLQPLQWENNRHKSDSYPHYSCAVKAA